jgi:[acyl-carrier-protein] S-malonyltransferase
MIAFVFPGQGAQAVGMGKALADAFPICREAFDESDAALGSPLSRLCFEGPEDQLLLTENAQPAILAVSVAACRLIESRGVQAAFAAGHSLGEYSAHVAAGTLSFARARCRPSSDWISTASRAPARTRRQRFPAVSCHRQI